MEQGFFLYVLLAEHFFFLSNSEGNVDRIFLSHLVHVVRSLSSL